MQNTILRIALPTPVRKLFDYLPPQDIDQKVLIPGVRVQVPFSSRLLVGLLVSCAKDSTLPYEKLKRASAILDDESLFSADVFELCKWASQYYHASLGEVLASALPNLLRKGKPLTYKDEIATEKLSEELHVLTLHQQQAVQTINQSKNNFQVFLLDGVTGSGKTEVYLQTIASILAEDKQVLVLVPEISLTPQTIARFRARFTVPIAALHSNLSDKERFQAWVAAKKGIAKIVIGTRSAVFTQFARLGLIIVDEEHDASFKQQDRFRYHARDLAIMRARFNKINIVLGSATPSVESYLNAKRQRYTLLTLPERVGKALLPSYQIIDISKLKLEEGLSTPLQTAIREHLDNNNQVLIFLNRRGYAPVFYCETCHFIVQCKRCDARMIYHQHPRRLQCHHCDANMKIPSECSQCHSNTFVPIGIGTQRLEKKLAECFPDVSIIRIDRDNTRRKDSITNLLQQMHAHPKAILLGTQMVAKGHHFPNVTMTGIVDIDSGFLSADFRAVENMAQLIVQVGGRAGRVNKTGTVIIQTLNPQHVLLQTLIQQGYRAFMEVLLQERTNAKLPPFISCALFRAEAYVEENATKFLETLKKLADSFTHTVNLYGPVSALLAKKKGLHCQQLLIKAERRSALQNFLTVLLPLIEKSAASTSVKWTLDVDPMEF